MRNIFIICFITIGLMGCANFKDEATLTKCLLLDNTRHHC